MGRRAFRMRAGGRPRTRLLGPYRIPNVRLEGMAVRTNKPGPGAYRAPGRAADGAGKGIQSGYAGSQARDRPGGDPLEERVGQGRRADDPARLAEGHHPQDRRVRPDGVNAS